MSSKIVKLSNTATNPIEVVFEPAGNFCTLNPNESVEIEITQRDAEKPLEMVIQNNKIVFIENNSVWVEKL